MDELARVTRGVWRRPDAVVDLEARCAVLLSTAPDGSRVGGLTAARLYGLWLPEPAQNERIEVVRGLNGSRPRTRARGTRPELHSRRRGVDPADTAFVSGVPVVGLATTWLHLAQTLSLPDLVAAGDSALRSGASLRQLTDAVRAGRRQRGVVRAREALSLLDARSRSRPESLLRVGLVVRGLPKPEVNKPLHDLLGQWLGEPDLSYEDVCLAIEYNGAGHADIDRMRRDITREIDLIERGEWRVLTVGPVQVFRRMDQVAALVRHLRSERARPRGGDRASDRPSDLVEWRVGRSSGEL